MDPGSSKDSPVPGEMAEGRGQRREQNKTQCEVLFDYQSQQENLLELKVGDIIDFIKEGDYAGWWYGSLNGKLGYFPSNYVKKVVASGAETEANKKMQFSYGSVVSEVRHMLWNVKGTAKAEKANVPWLEPMRSNNQLVRPSEFQISKDKLNNSGPPIVYKLPLDIIKTLDNDGCQIYSYGKESKRQNRTIMLAGATGAGKTTLINGMINYILGVKWEDPFRFLLVDDGKAKSQAESQTSEVNAYKINHQDGFQIDYSLTIIDTPGFGDTRGIERDRLISQQMQKLFTDPQGVSDIDAVCFVAQASLARLTHTQRYVFDSVLSMFGKDIDENITFMVTFADGQTPPVLEAIKVSGVPCLKTNKGQPLYFKFNNSALFATNKSLRANDAGACGGADDDDDDDDDLDSKDGTFDKMFWDMGSKSMEMFFKALPLIPTKSLTLTKEVLKERQMLESSVKNLQKQATLGLAKNEEIRQTIQILQTHKAEIAANKNFAFQVKIKKQVQVSHYKFNTNCQQCSTTCHYPCPYGNDKDKFKCSAFGPDGYCTKCPQKCHWTVHFNQKYNWDYQDVTEKRTVKELQKKYQTASKANLSVEQLMSKLRSEYRALQTDEANLEERSAKCLDRLKEIALMPNPLSTPDYIDLLIEGEKSEHKPGYIDCIKSLQELRAKAETIAKIDRKLNSHQGWFWAPKGASNH